MLISVHMPKTAGTSFRTALESHYGERLFKDYGDRPINEGTMRRNLRALHACVRNAGSPLAPYDAVHGHFMPLKYRCLKSAAKKRFVVWMRDPVERLASHYFYWKRSYANDVVGALQRRIVEENWSLERFCLGTEMQNTYSKFFWGFPLRRFDFIGVTEFYEHEMEQFCDRILGVPLQGEQVNVNPQHGRQRYIEDPALRNRIEAHHRADMLLYRQALELRLERTAGVAPETSADG